MNGGHFLTVICSLCTMSLKAFAGMLLNQSGIPITAGIGRGRTASSSGGQRNVIVGDGTSSVIAVTVGETASGDTASSVIAAIAPAAGFHESGLRNRAAALRRIQNRPRPADTRAFTAWP